MNKKSKRQLNIRNKLIGAIAMLLVSSIMVVSTTFAWFTLSTAPEVQGITTTVGANGNLEIALAHPTDNNLIGSDVGDGAETDWFVKNLTWGNLINLEDAKYGLSNITLLPSRLNIADGTNTMPDTVGAVPLEIPVYGSDGRINELEDDKVMYGASIPDNANVGKFLEGFRNVAGYPGYGVRALGTSSTMSETELAFRNALNAIASNRSAANITASKALQNHGAALADIAIIHANGDKAADGSTANYYAYVAKLTAMVTELRSATDNVEEALLNSLIAIANANIKIPGQTKTVGEMDFAGSTLRAYMNGDTVSLQAAWGALTGNATVYPYVQENFPQLVTAYSQWSDTNTRLATSETKLANLAAKTDKTAGWSDISNAMYDLMNIQKVTINGMTIEELKADANAAQKLMGGVALQMNAGSGVMANLGALTGNLSGRVTLGDNATYLGQSLAGIPIDLVTTTAPAEGALLTQIAAKISIAGAAAGDGESTTVIDVTYGYVLDFVFRTNAANSNLLLQTEGAQRIYGDSQNAATQGAGATMTFDGSYNNLDSLINMMSGIRVAFQSTTDGTGDANVHGIAKVVFKDSALKLNLVSANLASVEDATNAGTYVFTTTQATDAKAEETTVYVTVTENNGVLSTAICLNPNKHQYLVKETITDEATKTSYDRWTIKTAMWFEQVVESKETGADGSEITVYNKQEVELVNADGLVFYPEKDLDATTGTYTAWTDALKQAAVNAAAPTNIALDADRDAQAAGSQTVSEAVLANWTADAEPKYYHVYDEDNAEISLQGDLYLHEYDIAAGKLVFRGPKAAQILTGLDQNVVTPISALVYLDGDYVDNGDVINSENGISNTGKLNLQFASSAQLIPMENTELKTNIGVSFPKVEGLTFTGKDSVPADTEYSFTVTPADNNTKSYAIKARAEVEGVTVDLPLGNVTGTAAQTIKIPAASMKTNIEIIVEEVVTP